MRVSTTLFAILLATTTVMATEPGTENNGSKKESAKVVNVSQVLKENPYPVELRKLGIEGKVLVSFWVDSEGVVHKYKIEESSHAKLEEYVTEHVDKFRFTPAKNEKGKPIHSRIKVPFIFELSI